jgi:hypothetical protein
MNTIHLEKLVVGFLFQFKFYMWMQEIFDCLSLGFRIIVQNF